MVNSIDHYNKNGYCVLNAFTSQEYKRLKNFTDEWIKKVISSHSGIDVSFRDLSQYHKWGVEIGIKHNGLFAAVNRYIDPPMGIKKILHNEIDKYRVFFKDSEEGIIKKWPTEYDLYGWLISMKSGGKLRPHMHEKGWISGSVYINVPSKSRTDSGNLVVCKDDEDYLVDGKTSHENIIDVTTGSLCLFPASLLHYTIPFDSAEERIVLAFDVVPK